MAPNLYYSVIVDGQWQMLLQHVAQHTRKVRFLMLRMAAFLTEQLHWQNFGRLAVAVESTNLVSTLLIHEHIARSLSPAISFSFYLFRFRVVCQVQTHFGVVFKIRLIILKTIITFIAITFIVYIKFLKVDLDLHTVRRRNLKRGGGRERLLGQIL